VLPPVEGIDSAKCVDSTGLLAVETVPKRLIVLGGGVIGCEFASIFQHFGSEVTIVEFMPHLVPNEDPDAVKTLEKAFKGHGITMHLGTKATRVEETASGVTLHFEGSDGPGFVEGDLILVSTGRAPNVADLGLDDIGVAYDEKRGIRTDGTRRTGQPHIYAVGDVAGYWQLAHSAFREGEVAAENIAGHHVEMSGHVPRCIYTDPEVASVGMTEIEARETYGDDVTTGSVPFAAIARAAMYADKTGFVKTIHGGPYDELLGVVVVGINATEIINAGVIALDAEATIETVADSIAAHPTLAEGLKEAGLVALGRPIHLPPMKKRA
jgi:dihydrolipoamide dehydrogenase